MEDKLKRVGGVLDIEVTRDGPNGPVVISRRRVNNTVVNDGKEQLLRLMGGLQTNLFDQFRLGHSNTTVDSAQSNVLDPITDTFATADSITMSSGRTLQEVVSYPSGAGSLSASDIEEVALLNQNTSPGGSAFMRAVISPAVNKTTSDKLTITYNVRIT